MRLLDTIVDSVLSFLFSLFVSSSLFCLFRLLLIYNATTSFISVWKHLSMERLSVFRFWLVFPLNDLSHFACGLLIKLETPLQRNGTSIPVRHFMRLVYASALLWFLRVKFCLRFLSSKHCTFNENNLLLFKL